MVTIYHNPRCSKSRQTLELLQENRVEPEIRLYLEQPPVVDELKELLRKLDMQPRDIMRRKEAEYRESGADNPDLSADELIKKIADYPRLLERPIVVNGEKAAIGRPPENVLSIL